MTTNFPSSIDAFTNPTSADTLDNPPHDQQHADINDAMEAVQAKVGADSSSVASSLDYRVAALEQVSGRRNLLYNGAMQVAQRGTSASLLGSTSGGYYTADRWLWRNSGQMGVWTNTVVLDAPDGFANSFKTTCSTADTSPASADLLAVQQRLEGLDLQGLKFGTSSAESLTVSFWVKSNVTGTYAVAFETTDSWRYITKEYTINSSATWEKKTITFDGDTVASISNDNGTRLNLWFMLGSGSDYVGGDPQDSWGGFQTGGKFAGDQVNLASAVNNYWQITGVQLEVGDKATPFEHRSYGEELMSCYRYYVRNDTGSYTHPACYARTQTTNKSRAGFPLPVPMRGVPSVSIDGVWQISGTSVGAISALSVRPAYVILDISNTPQTEGALWGYSGGIYFDAEL